MIVTIDGPAGSGKSTVAKELAKRLAFVFLDTGAMYRAVAFECLAQKVDATNSAAVGELVRQMSLEFDGENILIGGNDVTDQLRSSEVTQLASVVAVNVDVRAVLVQLQRQFADGRNVVTEGRDQGTIVFPRAPCKFFITADLRERAIRRQRDLQQNRGVTISLDDLLVQIQERDLRDAQRDIAPMKPADDAVLIDTSALSANEVLDELEQQVQKKMSDS